MGMGGIGGSSTGGGRKRRGVGVGGAGMEGIVTSG